MHVHVHVARLAMSRSNQNGLFSQWKRLQLLHTEGTGHEVRDLIKIDLLKTNIVQIDENHNSLNNNVNCCPWPCMLITALVDFHLES